MMKQKIAENIVRKRLGLYIKLLIVIAVNMTGTASWAVAPADVNVAETVHNLSSTWPGEEPPDTRTVKATTQERICVFCHAPHNASPAAPLWNHEVTTASYTMYDSEYLQRVDSVYDTLPDLGSFPAAGYRSRLCLSCHDGTVAIGSVYNFSGGVYDVTGTTSRIDMAGVDTGGEMPGTSAAFLDTYLKDDHPVAIKYDEDAEISFDIGGPRSIELKSGLSKPPVQGVGGTYYEVRLYDYSGDSYVECTSCHDPHTTNEKFLVLNVNDNLAQTINAICDRCHEKTNWVGSIHQTDTTAINDPVGETQPIPGSTVAEAGCASCHKVHSGGGEPYLLRKAEEGACFYRVGVNASTSCHGQTASLTDSLNIYNQFQELYRHPTETTTDKHTNLDVLQIGITYDADDLRWDLGNEHAECVDCHNPHQAGQGTHSDPAGPSGWYPQTPSATTNDVSNSLTGVTGVDHPNDDPLWDEINLLSYRTMNSAVKEYQICFKCHSSYGIRNVATPVTIYTSGSGAVITDQAWEFSRGNKSAHPVRVTLNNMLTGTRGTAIPGSYTPKALTDAQMSLPWKNEGNQSMYCSDCHGAEDEDSTDPRGLHGSNAKFILKGENKYWPESSTATLFSLYDVANGANNWSSELFCANCHTLYSAGWENEVHAEHDSETYDPDGDSNPDNIYCIACHTVVPHGSRISRLIVYGESEGYGIDEEPYVYDGNNPGTDYAPIAGYKKPVGPTYDPNTAYTNLNCFSPITACHGANGHISDDGSYDRD